MTMEISWDLLKGIENEYGDSFYLLDLERFKNNYHEFLQAFRDIYPNTMIAYSYKTNYIPTLCQCVNSWGGYAEVVSRMEFDLASHIGVPPEKVIFNGPYKSESDMERALLAGSIVNLDSAYEVSVLEEVIRRSPTSDFSVGIRCNFDLETDETSRFGFDAEGEQLETVFNRLNGLRNCSVAGIHCHFSTSHRSVESYVLRTNKMLKIAAAYFEHTPLRFIDLGGGFFGKMSSDLQNQFPVAVPSYSEYAEAIAPKFANAFPGGSGPTLILEPGVAIAADVMKFVAKVVDIKKFPSRTVVLVSGSVYNIKPTLHDLNLPLRVESHKPGPEVCIETVDIVGNTCKEDDCLYRGYKGSISVGDYVVFDNVGAYTVVLKPPFIHPCPVILAYDSAEKELSIIKRQESFSDVFSTYEFQS